MRVGGWFSLTRPASALPVVVLLAAFHWPVKAAPTKPSPASATAPVAATAAVTPDRDRTTLISILQKKFPGVPPDDWSLGSATFTPGLSVIPLGGSNATNVNDILAIGRKAWERKFRDGKSLASCFPNGGQRAATNYPQVDGKSGVLTTLEDAINACLALHGEAPFALDSSLTMGAVSAYLRSLSIGQKLNVRIASPQATEHYLNGRRWFTRRIGEADLACASCHVLQAGQTREEAGKTVGLAAAVGLPLAWPRVEPGGGVRLLQQQFQRCMTRVGAAPFELGSDPFKQLEYFLGAVSNGLTVRGPIPAQ
jgi:sulfur-oxidizing protein SoxA